MPPATRVDSFGLTHRAFSVPPLGRLLRSLSPVLGWRRTKAHTVGWIAVVTSLVWAVGSPSSAAEPATIRATLKVEARELGTRERDVESVLLARGRAALWDEGVLGSRGTEAAEIHIIVTPGVERGFDFDVFARVQGDIVEGSRSVQACPECTETMIIDEAVRAAVRCVPSIEGEEPRKGSRPPPPRPRELEGAQPSGRPVPQLRPIGVAGVSMLVAGAAATIVGVAYAARGTVTTGQREAEAFNEHNLRPTGIGLAVAGGGLLVTGAILLAVERLRVRRPSAGRRKPRQ